MFSTLVYINVAQIQVFAGATVTVSCADGLYLSAATRLNYGTMCASATLTAGGGTYTVDANQCSGAISTLALCIARV